VLRRRLHAGAGGVAVALAMALPLVAFVPLFVARLAARRGDAAAADGRAWTLAWWAALAPLALVALVGWVVHGAPPTLLVTVALIALAAPLARLPRRAVFVGGAAALAVLVGLLALERLTAERTWYDPAVFPALDPQRVIALATGVDVVAPRASGEAVVERGWALTGTAAALLVEVDVRAVGAGQLAWFGVAPAAGGRAPWVEEPLELAPEWRRVTLRFEPDQLAAAAALRTTVRVQGPGRVELRDLRLRAEPGATIAPRPRLPRPRLWYGGPNLVGHTLALGGLMTAAAAPALVPAGATLLLAGAGVALTGSRTAAAVFVLCAALALLVRARPRTRWLLIAAFALAAVAASALLEPSDLGRLGAWSWDDRNVQSRGIEMRDALQALAAEPARGVGEGNLPSFAHNMWLQLGGEFGVPGLVAALWWSLAVLAIGWRSGALAGGVLALAFLGLQVVDDSWRYPGTFLPLLVGLSTLARVRGGASEGGG